MPKVKKEDTTVVWIAHRSRVMVSQLALSSEAQIAYLCQGELFKSKTKHS